MLQDEVSHYFCWFYLTNFYNKYHITTKKYKNNKNETEKVSKKSEKPIFFYNFIKENSKFSHLFLNCMLLQWKKNIFLTLVLKLGIKLLIYLG